jgi:predicted ATPase/DNA-binding SARP family transcriptional activator
VASVEFRVLGPLELVVGGKVVDCGGLKQRTLLAALLVRADRVVSVDELTEALWPDRAPATASNTLQVHVSTLRRCLGPERDRLETKPPGYVMRAGDTLDAVVFEGLSTSGREELAAGEAARAHRIFTEALGLWRGTAYADFVYEPFAEQASARLEALRMSTVADHMDARLALGHHHALTSELDVLVETSPTDERFCGQLMLALYRAGRQADALDAYRRLKLRLGEELGIVPSPKLQQLHDRIVLQASDLEVRLRPPLLPLSASITTGRPPPLPLTSFIGRSSERKLVAEGLERARLVTITGPGGSGKTRLAVEVASHAAQDRPVRFADLSLEVPERVLPAIAEAVGLLGAGAKDPDQLASELAAAMATQPELLLVIDNCEHVVDACAAVLNRLLSSVAGVQVLATSQVSLGVNGESLVPLAPLGLPEEGDSAETSAAADSVRLFSERAKDHDPGFVLSSETTKTIARICRQLDGLPLAIELAAAQIRTFDLEEIASRLEDALGFLASGSRTALERHRTLRATVEWSLELLTGDQRELLERLSVFNGGFTLARAERVCSGDGIAEEDVAQLLAQLVDRSLVVRRGSRGSERFRLLEPIRQHGWQSLTALS